MQLAWWSEEPLSRLRVSGLLEGNWVDLSGAITERVGSRSWMRVNENDGQSSEEDDGDLCDQEGEELRNVSCDYTFKTSKANWPS